jgi:peptide/nickel transport system substrate-binding protein
MGTRRRFGIRGGKAALYIGAVALAVAASGCATSNGSSTAPPSSTPVTGGTAVMAEPPSTTPNYIWPFAGSAYFTNINTDDLQYLLYRPLYWFGRSGEPTVNYALSLADPPLFDGDKVTITLQHYRWSNGTPVTAQDVMFWLNMELAEPANFGGYTGFPANVRDITAVSNTELTMVMSQGYSPAWFLSNDLSQITPMPATWDRTASGPSSCATTVSDCPAVFNYLNGQAKDLSTYATSPIWGVVDGPWKLSAFNADGHITFTANKSYSGPVKPKLAAFEEVPFTTDSTEYDVLQSPNSSTKIDVGYLPAEDAPSRPAGRTAGANPLAAKGYSLDPWKIWGINYYVVNYQSTTGNAPILKQLYFREALAYLMNQAAVISGPLRGYGTVTVGPVPDTPVTPFLSPKGRQGDPFPYSPGKARSLLASHGWNVVPGGMTTCAVPSRCGPGIAKGQGLSFNFPYATGFSWVTSEMTQLQSNAAVVGISLNLEPETFNQVTALAGGNCVVTRSSCDWDLANWAGGWSFAPDYLPTGEELFACGAVGDSGGFCDPANDSMIDQTLTSSNLQYMYEWQDYLAAQLPVLWQPDADYQLTEVTDNLRGVTPQSPTLSINPEDWYYVK